jgi:tRNA modification GTPase
MGGGAAAAGDTIVAIATAPGESAIAVTRLSGPDAFAIAARVFRGARNPLESESHRILFGEFVVPGAGGQPLDTVLLSLFRAPRSYTGEDSVEISSHGGAAIPNAILEALLSLGARAAGPGEFTERAFRNGKIDLAQAEAVASLVRARSDRALRAARATLGGDLSRRVAALDAELIEVLAEVEARLDFPRDVREAAETGALAARCAAAAASLREWIARLPSSRRREGGVRVAIVGAPNVGKSSLLNALLGFERAIVSDEPGTTRDTVEGSIWLDGAEWRLTDTAGLRETSDPVERAGVARTEREAAVSDLTIVVRDCSRPEAGAADAERLRSAGGLAIVAWNKSDLRGDGAAGRAGRASVEVEAEATVEVDTVAVRPGGVENLVAAMRAALPRLVGAGAGASDELPLANARQEALLVEAAAALGRAAGQLNAGATPEPAYDLAAVDLTDARRALGEILGRGVDDAVIAAIFQRFCIGK